MSYSKWNNAKKARLTIIIFGLIAIIFSWFLDQATQIEIVLRTVSPEFLEVKKVFNVLDDQLHEKVAISEKGSQILVEWWSTNPPSELKESVTYIGREDSFSIMPSGKRYYPLRLVTGEDNSVYLQDHVWRDDKAKDIMNDKLQSDLLRWKTIIFIVGLVSTILSVSWEFFYTKDKKG